MGGPTKSIILGVDRALGIVSGGSRAEEIAWRRDPRGAPIFGGQAPIMLLTNGAQDGIMLVRRYLDAFAQGVLAAPGRADLDVRPYADNDILII